MDASLPAIIDLPDGSFELRPDPKSVRLTKLALAYYAVFSTGVSAAFMVWSLTQPRIPWAFRVLPLVVSLSIDLFGWYVLKAPVLQADAMEVRSVAPMMRRRMARSDLALIFRGQVLVRGRYSTWVKSYLLVRRDGKIAIQAPGRTQATPSAKSRTSLFITSSMKEVGRSPQDLLPGGVTPGCSQRHARSRGRGTGG